MSPPSPAESRRVPLTGASVWPTDTKLGHCDTELRHWRDPWPESPEHTKGRPAECDLRWTPLFFTSSIPHRHADGNQPAKTRRTSVGSRPELARRCAPPRPRPAVAGCCGQLGGRFADRVRSGNACTMICTRSCDPSRCGGGSTLKVGPLSGDDMGRAAPRFLLPQDRGFFVAGIMLPSPPADTIT